MKEVCHNKKTEKYDVTSYIPGIALLKHMISSELPVRD